MRNQRTDTAHGSPVFWAEPFAAPRNLNGWSGPWDRAIREGLAWVWNEWWPRPLPDYDAHPAPLGLEPDDGDVSSPAAEADGGHVSGAGDVTAATGDEQDGHGDSVPPVAADGTWAPGLLGCAFEVGDGFQQPPWADVFTRDQTRVRVVLRRPVERGELIWERDIEGRVPGRSEG